MSTHEYWQFAFVADGLGTTLSDTQVGSGSPLRVEMSNLPIGSTPDPLDSTKVVTGDHVRIYWAFPIDLPHNEYTGNYKILKKTKEFPRDANDPTCVTVATGTVNNHVANVYNLVLDHIQHEHKPLWYYTVFFELNQGAPGTHPWVFSPVHGHGRGFALNSDSSNPQVQSYVDVVDVSDFSTTLVNATQGQIYRIGEGGRATDGRTYLPNDLIVLTSSMGGTFSNDKIDLIKNTSSYGEQLYSYFPGGIRELDHTDGNQTLHKLCKSIGRSFDEVQERLDQYKSSRYNIDTVDAAFIPYIDQMLGWPTNYELKETRRRLETSKIIDAWKSKGTSSAMIEALEDATGWNLEYYEGYKYTLTTATRDDFLNPNSVPTGWDETTDGVWADLVNALPFNGTYRHTPAPPHSFTEGDPANTVCNIYNNDNWQNTYGLLLRLMNSVGDDYLSEALAKEKVRRLLPYLVVHYAKYVIDVAS